MSNLTWLTRFRAISFINLKIPSHCSVRGEIYHAAVKRVQEGKEVIYTNVGNPHALVTYPLRSVGKNDVA